MYEVNKRRDAEEAERIARREVERQRDGLEDMVQVRTHDLALARNAAEAASRSKSEFLATLSHEIRTQMNGILGMTELLQGTPLSPQQRRVADAVYHSGEHLLTLINDVLNFSKIEAGKLEIETIDFKLRQLVEDAGHLFARAAQAKGLEMVCVLPHDLPAALKGDPVLVVDDNTINQMVAVAVLESLGLTHATAENGLIALEQLSRASFDLVLMDCQMPEMDGFEATAVIRHRQREGLLGRTLPVIALTANAVEGDRERCIAAGMDDYLSKPYSRDQLIVMLERWLPAQGPTPRD